MNARSSAPKSAKANPSLSSMREMTPRTRPRGDVVFGTEKGTDRTDEATLDVAMSVPHHEHFGGRAAWPHQPQSSAIDSARPALMLGDGRIDQIGQWVHIQAPLHAVRLTQRR